MRQHRSERNDLRNFGGGAIFTENGTVSFEKGGAILIEKGEKYFWDANAEVVMACSSAWTAEQHKFVK